MVFLLRDKTQNPDSDAVVVRFLAVVDLHTIDAIIDDIPEEAYGTLLLSDAMRQSHKRLLRERLERGF